MKNNEIFKRFKGRNLPFPGTEFSPDSQAFQERGKTLGIFKGFSRDFQGIF